MLSATDFFPSSVTLFMNFDSTVSPKRGSGRISRRSGRRRRAIGYSFTTASRREALWADQIAEKAVFTSDASRRISTGRPDERRVGKEWDDTCISRWLRYH